MDELYYTSIDLLKHLIATPSTSRNEEEAANIIVDFLSSNGHIPRRHGNNVWAIAPGYNNSLPTILLNSHIDTVKPVDGWSLDPYTPTIDASERLFGLGSNDAGASVVSLLAAFIYMSDKKLNKYKNRYYHCKKQDSSCFVLIIKIKKILFSFCSNVS